MLQTSTDGCKAFLRAKRADVVECISTRLYAIDCPVSVGQGCPESFEVRMPSQTLHAHSATDTKATGPGVPGYAFLAFDGRCKGLDAGIAHSIVEMHGNRRCNQLVNLNNLTVSLTRLLNTIQCIVAIVLCVFTLESLAGSDPSKGLCVFTCDLKGYDI